MRIHTKSNHSVPVIVAGNNNINNLGVVRSLGRHGIPIILLSSNPQDFVRYSRYTSKRSASPNIKESETQFINFLLDQVKQLDEKCIIIPTNDATVMALSRYKEELEKYCLLPIPSLEIVQKLVDKSKFYQLLDQLAIPCPKTYFPTDISELKSMGHEIEYPYIIKPAFAHLFVKEFGTKCFVIESAQDLNLASERLENKDLDVVIQEIIPGNELYSLSTYFNKDSAPLAICGYDKLRQYPPDFGIGSLWRSAWRTDPINSATKVLKTLGYHGMAEPEFKKDPRDGQYKFLEINARTVIPNSLPAKCGVDISYITYLDTIGQYNGSFSGSPQSGILWISEIIDFRCCFKQIREGNLTFKEAAVSLRGKKVYATAAWDDPLPFFIQLLYFATSVLKRLFRIRRRNNQYKETF